jgi:hypothetical protein
LELELELELAVNRYCQLPLKPRCLQCHGSEGALLRLQCRWSYHH